MAHPLYVAFVWHQHQPQYKSRLTGTYRMPWVRLHALKDYLDLVLLLERYPRLHQTVNLVPSLLLQLEDYAAGRAMDPYLALSLKSADALTPEERAFVVDRFFDAHHRTMIDPHPRYRALYEQAQQRGSFWCMQHWQAADFEDLLTWHTLAWIDPLFREEEPVAGWFARGQGFTLADREAIWAWQQRLIERIIPEHRRLQETGQLELTTSPYTHPILPLLTDSAAGRVALPELPLPRVPFTWPEDVPVHLRRGWQLHEARFGRPPRGLWPPEQSVSPAILEPVAAQGYRWLISDEAVLGWSLGHFFHRDSRGQIREPQHLYRPYRIETLYGDLALVFRDHRLSDLIGFSYSALSPQAAVSDFIFHLEAIAYSLEQYENQGSTALEQPWLVTIALDGENCWEFYPEDGRPFLEALYTALSRHTDLALVTVSEFLEAHPPTATLTADQLHSGSWIDGNFTTWIGDPVKNRAWELLAEARAVLHRHQATETTHPEAWEALLAAEGSDFFWWFGHGHCSRDDALFDQLFREHLQALYQALGEPLPSKLIQSLETHGRPGDHLPEMLIHPLIDGRGDEQDWERAGYLLVGGARGTMHQSSPVQAVYYGVDHLHLYLRIDFQMGVRFGEDFPEELHLAWFYPGTVTVTSPLPLANVPSAAPCNYRYRHHLGVNLTDTTCWLAVAADHNQWQPQPTQVRLALNQCLEMALPWQDLGVTPGWTARLLLVFAQTGQFRFHLPEQELLEVTIP